MELNGYIQEIKENSFAIPIYSDGIDYYFHKIDSIFCIIGFEKAFIKENLIKKLFSTTDFKKGKKAFIVYVGKDNVVFFGTPENTYKIIESYLIKTTTEYENIYIKKEVNELKENVENYPNIKRKKTIKSIIQKFTLNTMQKDVFFNDTFEELEKIENPPLDVISLSVAELKNKNAIKSFIEEAIFQNKSKEVLFVLFKNFLADNDIVFKQILINSEISNRFSEYLVKRKDNNNSIEFSFEETLKLMDSERRNKLKDLNYKFINYMPLIDDLEKKPVYKRFDIDIELNLFSKYSNSIKQFEKLNIPDEEKIIK